MIFISYQLSFTHLSINTMLFWGMNSPVYTPLLRVTSYSCYGRHSQSKKGVLLIGCCSTVLRGCFALLVSCSASREVDNCANLSHRPLDHTPPKKLHLWHAQLCDNSDLCMSPRTSQAHCFPGCRGATQTWDSICVYPQDIPGCRDLGIVGIPSQDILGCRGLGIPVKE